MPPDASSGEDLIHGDFKRPQPQLDNLPASEWRPPISDQFCVVWKVAHQLQSSSRRRFQADAFIEAEAQASGLKIHVVHEHQPTITLEVCVSINLILPGVTEDALLPVEPCFILFSQLLQPRPEGDVVAAEGVKVAPELEEQQVSASQVHHQGHAPAFLSHAVAPPSVRNPHSQTVLADGRNEFSKLITLIQN